MADYSVTIRLSAGNPLQVQQDVERAFGAAVARQAVITTWGEPNFYRDSCRELNHFGCTHWTNDDIENKCDELGITATPELLKHVRANAAHIDDGMTELGWEVIESAILDASYGVHNE